MSTTVGHGPERADCSYTLFTSAVQTLLGRSDFFFMCVGEGETV